MIIFLQVFITIHFKSNTFILLFNPFQRNIAFQGV